MGILVSKMLGVVAALLCAVQCSNASPIAYVGTPAFDGVVRPQADNSSAAYMIPPYKSNHASTIESLPDGTLTAAWFSGVKEEAPGCAIVFASLAPSAMGWSKARTLSERNKYSDQ